MKAELIKQRLNQGYKLADVCANIPYEEPITTSPTKETGEDV